jgi:TIR domain-containing protein
VPDSEPICFWSYTHRDDDLEGGRIRRLAQAIANGYEILTGERLALFMDHNEIEWGDQWRTVIGDALARTAFFVPIVTPLYLRSEECRREFVEFAGRVASVGARDLLMPILYVDTPQVSDRGNDDEIARLVRDTQYADWRGLRLADESAQEYRSAVHSLAAKLVSVMEAVSARPIILPEEIDDDEPGFLDHIAVTEENITGWDGLMSEIATLMRELTEITQAGAERIRESDRRGGRAAGRLVALKQFADEIRAPAERMRSLGNEFGSSVVASDPGIQALIRAALVEQTDSEGLARRDRFFSSVHTLAAAALRLSDALRQVVSQLDQASSLSRVARTPLSQLKSGVSAVLDATVVLRGWSRLIGDGIESVS